MEGVTASLFKRLITSVLSTHLIYKKLFNYKRFNAEICTSLSWNFKRSSFLALPSWIATSAFSKRSTEIVGFFFTCSPCASVSLSVTNPNIWLIP